MKKQFFRVKQLADQTFSRYSFVIPPLFYLFSGRNCLIKHLNFRFRAGKTEALSDDLIQAEKRIEFLNKTCQNISKKLASTLLGLGQDSSARDKRIVSNYDIINRSLKSPDD